MLKIASKKKRLLAYFWDWAILLGPLVIAPVLWALVKLAGYLLGIEVFQGVTAINPESPPTFGSFAATGTMAVFVIIALLGCVWFVVFAIVNLVQVSKTGQTLGKKRVGIQIVNWRNSRKVSVWRFLGRNVLTYFLASILSNNILKIFFLVDNGWILFDKNNEALHDKIWRTRVVVKN